MSGIILKNKPLVEAIFELRWELQQSEGGLKIDPHYEIFLGRLFDRLRSLYPFHERLPSASIPGEIAGYIVQHRFRREKNKWPLIQSGPGLLTLNNTSDYTWTGFLDQIKQLLDAFIDVYPDLKSLRLQNLVLRYINAIEFNFETDDIFVFLKEKMKMDIHLHQDLFESTEVENKSINLDLRFTFPARRPQGVVHLRFTRGMQNDTDALIWEIIFHSEDINTSPSKEDVITWADNAHIVIEDWFFKIIQGDLLKQFE